uniref:Secreted protein n=1 Tax=Haemonchus contortus TaxID=6289 RepID=A0A7I4YM50_HAECO
MFMRNKMILTALLTLNRANISECSSYVYLCQHDERPSSAELSRREGTVVKKTKNIRLCAKLFDTCPSSFKVCLGDLAVQKQDEHAVSDSQRA